MEMSLEEVLKSQVNEVTLLYEAGRLLGATLDPSKIYDTLQGIIARVMDCESLLVSLYTPEDNTIRCTYAWIEGQHTDVSQFPVLALAPEGKGMQSQVIRTGEPLLLSDVFTQNNQSKMHYINADGTVDPEPDEKTTRSILIVPITLEGRVLGVTQVMSPRVAAYTTDHLRFLEAILIQVAAASRNAFLYQQAKQEIAERERIAQENARLIQELKEASHRQRIFLRDMLASVTEGKLRLCESSDQLPPHLSPADAPVPLVASDDLRTLRHEVAEVAQQLRFPDARCQNLITAVHEAAMNALVHAGSGVGSPYARPDGTIQVWIEDQGQGINVENLPRATLERGYTTAGTLGHGMKMMLQTADRIWLLTNPSGTTVVIEQDRIAPEPLW